MSRNIQSLFSSSDLACPLLSSKRDLDRFSQRAQKVDNGSHTFHPVELIVVGSRTLTQHFETITNMASDSRVWFLNILSQYMTIFSPLLTPTVNSSIWVEWCCHCNCRSKHFCGITGSSDKPIYCSLSQEKLKIQNYVLNSVSLRVLWDRRLTHCISITVENEIVQSPH